MSRDRISGYRITISPEADAAAFEEAMKTQVFPRAGVGRVTRGGTVTRQSLLKDASPTSGTGYAWLVEWTSGGGSPFGSSGLGDPARHLTGHEVETSRFEYEVVSTEPAI